jgi:hypothetical protein
MVLTLPYGAGLALTATQGRRDLLALTALTVLTVWTVRTARQELSHLAKYRDLVALDRLTGIAHIG